MKIVFDIGGTNTRIGLVSRGKLGPIKHFKTDVSDSGIDSMVMEILEFAAGHKIDALVGGFPGFVDRESGKIVRAQNLPEWEGLSFNSILSHALSAQVRTVNDVVLAGLGEAFMGSGKGYEIVTYFTVSTGVNGVRIVDGRVDKNARGFEIGFQLMSDDAGNMSTLEGLVGGASLRQRTGLAPKDIRDPNIWHQSTKYLARGIYNSCLHWSPDVVIIGGPMMHDIPLDEVIEEIHKLPMIGGGWPDILAASLGDDRGLIGALALLEQ